VNFLFADKILNEPLLNVKEMPGFVLKQYIFSGYQYG